jgi:PEGA domain
MRKQTDAQGCQNTSSRGYPSEKCATCCFDVASYKERTTVAAMFAKIIGALGLTVLLSSCATVVRGVHEDLRVLSEPVGANVYLSTGEKGVTPATFRKRRRSNSFLVTITKPGYYSQTVTVKSKASATGATAAAGNVATVGLGVAVDAGTGAWDSLYPNPISVRLVPQPGEHPARNKRLASGSYPVAVPAERAGMVRSPYTRRLYDVHAVPHGSLVHDVDVDKFFLNP